MQALNRVLEQAPGLHSLLDKIRQSQACLLAVGNVIPQNLKSQIQAGPLNDQEWCLLVKSPAASTKLRQLTPRLLLVLQQDGWDINHIRIKIQSITATSAIQKKPL
jgi:hypothetical protein